jgi:hypothetical protein
MQGLKIDLVAALNNHKDELIINVCKRLQQFSPSHYEVIDFERHQEREEEFLQVIHKALQEDDNHSLVEYMEDLAHRRSNEGYQLEEVQQAVAIFEDELWRALIASLPIQKELVDILAACNRAFGRAKDHLARGYLRKAMETQKELDDLSQRFYAYRHDKKDSTGEGERLMIQQ